MGATRGLGGSKGSSRGENRVTMEHGAGDSGEVTDDVVAGAGSENHQQLEPSTEEEPVFQLSDAYVHSLASLGLERLQNEPGRLHAEAAAVNEVRSQRNMHCGATT